REQERKRRNQWVLPVTGYTLTARFGQQSSMWSSGAHTGLDFAGPSGTKIVALAAGTVKSAGFAGAYGNQTVIVLTDGTEISYNHQSRIVAKVGDKVTPGQLTGYTGATGNVTGPHLHLEVKPPGAAGPVDPEPVLKAHGISP
ncbi:M23 family metallopeptidase, partial [Aeromicrobium sp.]|uniref:M23 family metallopeptidase n=1 Tax=Aeromicrobium sp. TaxID=1871063 RepID=UPI0019CEF176